MCHRYLICQLTGEGEKGAGQLGDLEVVTLAAAPEIRPAGEWRHIALEIPFHSSTHKDRVINAYSQQMLPVGADRAGITETFLIVCVPIGYSFLPASVSFHGCSLFF